jgi:hypothetical protein
MEFWQGIDRSQALMRCLELIGRASAEVPSAVILPFHFEASQRKKRNTLREIGLAEQQRDKSWIYSESIPKTSTASKTSRSSPQLCGPV